MIKRKARRLQKLKQNKIRTLESKAEGKRKSCDAYILSRDNAERFFLLFL